LPFQEPGEALAFVGPDAVAVSAVGNADGLASQGGGLPQSAGISLGAGALARLQADFVVATGGIALRLAELSRSVQFIARIAEAGAVQVAAAMRTAQRTGGHTVVAVVEHEVREAPADAARQAEAVLLAPLPAVGDALAPIVLVPGLWHPRGVCGSRAVRLLPRLPEDGGAGMSTRLRSGLRIRKVRGAQPVRVFRRIH